MEKLADVFLADAPGLLVFAFEPERTGNPKDDDQAGEENEPLLQLHPESDSNA